MISGHATSEGTATFAQSSPAEKSNYKKFQDLTLSNVGIGTYLGGTDLETDILMKSAIKESILAGINVIDTAINYRSQKSERSVGNAIKELIEEKKITRDQVFISSKNGYVTNDADVQKDFWQYVNSEYVQKNVITAGDISSGYHCMTLSYLEDQLKRSLDNLGLECLDLMYIHNAAEGQMQDISRDEFLSKLKNVFDLYERKRRDGKIRFYGMATWECFRVPKENPLYLSLEEMISLARDAGGNDNGFRFVQLPYNFFYDQALLLRNQPDNKSFLEAAQENNIGIFTSVPLMQGRLLSPGVMPEFNQQPPNIRGLQFIRSTPGILAPLVGHKTPSHVHENLKIMAMPPMESCEFAELVKKLTA